MKRIILAVVAVFCLLVAFAPRSAWAAPSSSAYPVITFDDAAHQAELTIPTPACATTQPTCEWKFFLNEPKLSVDVATIYGTSGTLVIPYPPNFCGVIQADAYVGPPWVAKRGFQHTIADCTPTPTSLPAPSPTTVPVAPPASTTTTTSTTAPPALTTTTPSLGPTVAAATTPSLGPTVAAATSTSPTTSPVGAPGNTAAGSDTQALPFTGVNIVALFFIGAALAAVGLLLLRRRRSQA
jgi:LPXTG-motif cell wall-anchored protein